VKIPFKTERVGGQEVIVVDGEVFDWGLDEDSISHANRFSSNKDTMRAIHEDIRKYFLESIGELLGFEVSMRDINEALRAGCIDDKR
jgi:hypothetical protein